MYRNEHHGAFPSSFVDLAQSERIEALDIFFCQSSGIDPPRLATLNDLAQAIKDRARGLYIYSQPKDPLTVDSKAVLVYESTIDSDDASYYELLVDGTIKSVHENDAATIGADELNDAVKVPWWPSPAYVMAIPSGSTFDLAGEKRADRTLEKCPPYLYD